MAVGGTPDRVQAGSEGLVPHGEEKKGAVSQAGPKPLMTAEGLPRHATLLLGSEEKVATIADVFQKGITQLEPSDTEEASSEEPLSDTPEDLPESPTFEATTADIDDISADFFAFLNAGQEAADVIEIEQTKEVIAVDMYQRAAANLKPIIVMYEGMLIRANLLVEKGLAMDLRNIPLAGKTVGDMFRPHPEAGYQEGLQVEIDGEIFTVGPSLTPDEIHEMQNIVAEFISEFTKMQKTETKEKKEEAKISQETTKEKQPFEPQKSTPKSERKEEKESKAEKKQFVRQEGRETAKEIAQVETAARARDSEREKEARRDLEEKRRLEKEILAEEVKTGEIKRGALHKSILHQEVLKAHVIKQVPRTNLNRRLP